MALEGTPVAISTRSLRDVVLRNSFIHKHTYRDTHIQDPLRLSNQFMNERKNAILSFMLLAFFYLFSFFLLFSLWIHWNFVTFTQECRKLIGNTFSAVTFTFPKGIKAAFLYSLFISKKKKFVPFLCKMYFKSGKFPLFSFK